MDWYGYRWLVERFHYVLKSGCKLEERQLKTQACLERLLAVFNIVAWRLLWLTYQACQTPEASCLVALSEEEWQALYAHHHHTTQLPATPPTLLEVTRWIAKLGGFFIPLPEMWVMYSHSRLKIPTFEKGSGVRSILP